MGVGGERTPMVVPLSLNLNGSAITVSTGLAQAMRAVDAAQQLQEALGKLGWAAVRTFGVRKLTLIAVILSSEWRCVYSLIDQPN